MFTRMPKRVRHALWIHPGYGQLASGSQVQSTLDAFTFSLKYRSILGILVTVVGLLDSQALAAVASELGQESVLDQWLHLRGRREGA